MRIFLSHSSTYKPLLRELRTYLPKHFTTWLDEDRLMIGDGIEVSLQDAIGTQSDFVVLFIDRRAAESAWVRKEVEWALAYEKKIGRTFLLPVVLEQSAWESFEPEELRKRKCLVCSDFTENGIKALANELASQLFGLIMRDLERSREADADEQTSVLSEADKYLRSIAAEIRTVVHPYRAENPLSVESLHERLHTVDAVMRLTLKQFNELLTRLNQQSLLAGLVFDGEEIYLEEEHYSWKTEAFTDAKRRIARRAAKMVKSGDLVILDAGSTTDEIARLLAKALVLKRLSSLRVVTNSLPAARDLVSVATDLGLTDDNSILQVYIMGGRVRPNTLAIVGIDSPESSQENLEHLVKSLPGPGICFVGTNGISSKGFTTHTAWEAATKSTMLRLADRKVIVSDPSKFGLSQEKVFADLDQPIEVITIKDGHEEILQTFEATFAGRKASLTYA